jgi:hypothetical protein
MCISSPEEDGYISTNDYPSYYKELIATLAISLYFRENSPQWAILLFVKDSFPR